MATTTESSSKDSLGCVPQHWKLPMNATRTSRFPVVATSSCRPLGRPDCSSWPGMARPSAAIRPDQPLNAEVVFLEEGRDVKNLVVLALLTGLGGCVSSGPYASIGTTQLVMA